MKIPLPLRYAMLISLCMLIWLALEAVVGLHDKYIAYHPYLSMLSLFIPVVFGYLAVKQKREELGGSITLKQALLTGVYVVLITTVLAIPVQFIFHNWINPYFFQDMIDYAVANGKSSPQQAAMYFNLTSYIIQSVLGTLVFGNLIALVVALLMRNKK